MQDYNSEYQDFDDLREQVSLLKNKLDAQAILSQNSMLNAVRKSVSKLGRNSWQISLMGFLGAAFCFWAFYCFMDFSLWFAIFTSVMMTVAGAFHMAIHRRMNNVDISRRNLLEVANEVTRFRHIYTKWPLYCVPILMIWLFWLVFEEALMIPSDSLRDGFYTGGSFGLIIGGIIGLRMRRKVINDATKVLEQIRELQESEKLLADK